MAGGEDVFAELGLRSLGRDRVIADPMEPVRRAPDVIVASWCGKKFRPERMIARDGWDAIPAVREGRLHAIPSCDILQPGPAALGEGLDRLHRHFADWAAGQPTSSASGGTTQGCCGRTQVDSTIQRVT